MNCGPKWTRSRRECPASKLEMRAAITAEAAEEAEARGDVREQRRRRGGRGSPVARPYPANRLFRAGQRRHRNRGPRCRVERGAEGSHRRGEGRAGSSLGAFGGPRLHHHGRERWAGNAAAHSSNGCSVLASWIRSACGSIPCRPGVPSGRLSRAAWRRHRRRKATQRQRPSRRYSPTPT